MDAKKEHRHSKELTMVDWVVKLMNFNMLLFLPRKASNFRWAITSKDVPCYRGEFSGGQFTKVYGRVTSKYKFHPQQQYENAMRRFDVVDALGAQMKQTGNLAFYKAILGQNTLPDMTEHEVDLTRIGDLNTISASGDYLYREILSRKNEKAAQAARASYARGYSRVVDALDSEDWKRLRTELRNSQHLGAGVEDTPGESVLLVALSYKGTSVKITRRMRLFKEDGTPDDEEGLLAQTEIDMSSDFVDDFRWSQLVRSCKAIAKQRGIDKIRVWIDRLVMMGRSIEERSQVYEVLEWEEFGMFAYAVCPVVRLYDAQEPLYGTDFWRKLETVLGVAGRGIVVDDYMLRKYDKTLYFGSSMYERLHNGISSIGGTGIYLRSVTLALATAVLTDGVSVSAVNEDYRTVRSANAWKAWALRTIAEGAYSRSHTSMLRQEESFVVSLREFMTIAFWESRVSVCPMLTGKSYLDMSYQKSMSWRKCSNWDGIIEWIGMMPSCCEVRESSEIMQFLRQNAQMSMWTTTTGHAASIITLRSADQVHKRCIVVNLARFSTIGDGHVVGVAEATGLWANSLLPRYFRFLPDPDHDQKVTIEEEGVLYSYEAMKFRLRLVDLPPMVVFVLTVVVLVALAIGCFVLGTSNSGFFHLLGVVLLVVAIAVVVVRLMSWSLTWPWEDTDDVGEAVFDNLLLHALYGAGIKEKYRNLRAKFEDISWS